MQFRKLESCAILWGMSLLLHLLTAPAKALALEDRSVVLNTGIRISWVEAFSNLTGFVAGSAIGVCTLLFLYGAGQLVISRGDQTQVDNGKKAMINALIGLAIVLASYGILRTVLYFLYEGAP